MKPNCFAWLAPAGVCGIMLPIQIQAQSPKELNKPNIVFILADDMGYECVGAYGGTYQNYAVTESGEIVTWGLKGYLLGSDDLGRDVFTRILNGGRMTMTIGAISVIISTIIGIIIGGISGFFGGSGKKGSRYSFRVST